MPRAGKEKWEAAKPTLWKQKSSAGLLFCKLIVTYPIHTHNLLTVQISFCIHIQNESLTLVTVLPLSQMGIGCTLLYASGIIP